MQAAHRRLWCFCVCGVWLALSLVRVSRDRERERDTYVLRPPKFVRMRVRVRIRIHVTGGVLARGLTCVGRLSEQPHWRWPKQGAAVAKQGGQAKCPLQGIPSEKAASGGCGPISTNHVALFGLSCTQFYPAPCFGHIPTRYTLFWPPSFYLCLRYEYTICLSYCCCCSHINSSLQCSPWSQHRLQQRWSGKLPQEENK